MFCSLDKIDLVVGPDGQIAVQTDHRSAAEIDAQRDLSTLFALTRARNPQRNDFQTVRFAGMQGPPPAWYLRLVQIAGAEFEVEDGMHAAEPDEQEQLTLATAALSSLGRQIIQENGITKDLAGLEQLESQQRQRVTDSGEKEDELTYWTAVVELGAAVGVVLTSIYGGTWKADPGFHSHVPFVLSVPSASGDAMGNVFGKVERFFEEGLSEAPSTLFTMLADVNAAPPADTAVVYPALRAKEWAGKATSICGPLLADSPKTEGVNIPLVALVHDLPETTRSIPQPDSDAEGTDLKRQAAISIAALEVSVEELELGDMTLAITGSYYASEKILDAQFMKSLQARLGCDKLAVTVPVRGAAFVTAAEAPVEQLAMFAQFSAFQYEEAPPKERISEVIFLFEEGRPVAFASSVDE